MKSMKIISFIAVLLVLCCSALAFAGGGEAVPADAVGAVAAAVNTVAPLLPSPWNIIAAAVLPLVGVITNFWWRWRAADKDAEKRQAAARLIKDAIAYAEEVAAAAAKMERPLAGSEKLRTAVDYVVAFDKAGVFAGLAEIEKRITTALAQTEGVGATGAMALSAEI